MSRLLFTKRHVVKQGDGNGPVYEAGQVYEFEGFSAETYATKYKRLGYAVDAILEEQVAQIVREETQKAFDAMPEPISTLSGPEFTGAYEEPVAQPKRRGRPPRNA